MNTRRFALVLGIVYVLVGIVGFIPGLTTPPPANAPALAVNSNYGYIFGLFAVNIVHTLIHLVVGLWGILAYRSYGGAKAFARAIAIIFAILTIMGLIPGGLDTTFGLAPIFGADVALHALTALVAAYFGFVAHEEAEFTGNPPADTAL